MLRSEDRVLTTHTCSLPRPPALTSLYVRRSRGEAIDAAELDRVGKAAVHEVVAKQLAAGIDVYDRRRDARHSLPPDRQRATDRFPKFPVLCALLGRTAACSVPSSARARRESNFVATVKLSCALSAASQTRRRCVQARR